MFISNESVSDDFLVDWGERLGCGMNGFGQKYSFEYFLIFKKSQGIFF